MWLYIDIFQARKKVEFPTRQLESEKIDGKIMLYCIVSFNLLKLFLMGIASVIYYLNTYMLEGENDGINS
jgi:hypothetical protein